jgi:putative ABC transport system permease protein
MFQNNLKISLRNLIKHKTFSLINILGFAFGISVCLLIVLFLIKEYSYDSYNTNSDRIYRLVDVANNSSAIDYRIAPSIVNNFPEVENACVSYVLPLKFGASYRNNGFGVDGIMSVSNSYFEMFTTHLLRGSSAKPLSNLNSAILTESFARKMFGEEDPIGKEIVLMRNFFLIVSGVIEDFPENSSIHANMIVNMENDNFKFRKDIGDSRDKSTYRYPFNIYLLLREKSDPIQLVKKINSHPETTQPYIEKAGLMALTDTYLRDNTTGSTTKKGNPSLLRLFTGIALVVLLLAIINYINLSIAQQNKRSKETGIRKTIGARRSSIVFLFLTESVFVTCIAFALGLVMTEAALPFFSNIVDSQMTIQPLMQFPASLILFVSVLIVGIISGIVPAILFSSFNPIRVLSGRMIASGKNKYFRNILTVFQFTVSIALIFCIIVIQRQISYAKHDDLGFEKEQLLRIDLPFADAGGGSVLMNKLRECPFVKNVTASNGVPGNVRLHMGSGIENKDQHLLCISADSNFLNTFKIEIIEGRQLLPGDYGQVCMFNETAYKYFGWNNLDNKKYNNGRKGGFEVIGVVKDFHTASLHQSIEPTCILFTSQYSLSTVSLQIEKGTTVQTIAYLQKVWKEIFPDYPLDYQFYDEWFNQMYAKDERFANAIGLFGFLAITISSLGILGLAISSSERRVKENAIRKVYGASMNDLMVSLNKDSIKLVIVAFMIACPIGWYAMNQWLTDFAYRTEISWWVFALSGLTALAIALLTVSWQTWRAAIKNPVEALRYE